MERICVQCPVLLIWGGSCRKWRGWCSTRVELISWDPFPFSQKKTQKKDSVALEWFGVWVSSLFSWPPKTATFLLNEQLLQTFDPHLFGSMAATRAWRIWLPDPTWPSESLGRFNLTWKITFYLKIQYPNNKGESFQTFLLTMNNTSRIFVDFQFQKLLPSTSLAPLGNAMKDWNSSMVCSKDRSLKTTWFSS